MEREQLLESYRKMKNVISKLLEEQERLETLSEECENAQKEENSIRTGGGLIFGLFACFAVVLLIGGGFYAVKAINVSILKAVLWLGAGVISGIIVLAVGAEIDDNVNGETKNEKADEYHKSTVEPLFAEIEREKEKIDMLWNTEEMKQFEETIPEEYQTLEILTFFVHMLEVKRADTEKELYNLYEEELHRQQMKEMQTQQLQYAEQSLETQQKQLEAMNKQNEISQQELSQLKEIKKRQKKLSRQTRYGNVVSTIDFLRK